MGNFKEYSTIYNLLYSDKDYPREVEYIHNVLRKYGVHAILEYGSGTGIHGCLLAERGYTVEGVELSEGMFVQAQQRIADKQLDARFTVHNSDIRTFAIDKKFDAVISMFHVISYLTDNADVVQTFQNAASHLDQGGIFLFDVWYLPAVLTLHPQNKIKHAESTEYSLYRFTAPTIQHERNVVDVKFSSILSDKRTNTIAVIEELHAMRYFSSPEIHLFASLAGFEVIHSEEFLTSNPPSENTWGVCYLLKKM